MNKESSPNQASAGVISRRSFLQTAGAVSVSAALPVQAQTKQCTDSSPIPKLYAPPVIPPITDRRMRKAVKPFVNQGGYNLGEAKRFTCPGSADGTAFRIRAEGKPHVVFHGVIRGNAGDFTAFDPPSSPQRYVIEVEGLQPSQPFVIANHIMERISSRLAYQFFIDCRGGFSPQLSPSNVTGGGPCRDGGGQTLEATFEGLLYASNPALFGQWFQELRRLRVEGSARPSPADPLIPLVPPPDVSRIPAPINLTDEDPSWQRTPDLIKLLLWHAEFAWTNHQYCGRTGGFERRSVGYEAWVRRFGYDDAHLQDFDYQNLLDQLAAVHAFYGPFLKAYLPEATHQQYRQACLDLWEKYDRHKEVRYWVRSFKWIDVGRLEFSEQGNAFGQGLLRNLLMYAGEKEERNGQPERFLGYARECAADIVAHWDFNNPVHTWKARNAEHITPQALAMFALMAPDEMRQEVRNKLEAWRDYILTRTRNLWQYRTHSDTEWAHPQSKEMGTVAGLAGAMFAVAHVLGDEQLRAIGWSQVNFVFGCNPAGAHLSHRSACRVNLGGYWEGVEIGWPISMPYGTGKLGDVRGTLDGSPTDAAFPYNPDEAATFDKPGIYGTEGWSITNRAWMTAVTFSTMGSHRVRVLDPVSGKPISRAKPGQAVHLELRAALNQSWTEPGAGWLEVQTAPGSVEKITVREPHPNAGVFVAEYVVPANASHVVVSYGYLCFRKTCTVTVTS